MKVVERLLGAGFRPIAIPLYENALCLHQGECAAVLAPVAGGGLKLLAPPSILVNGNFGVRLKRSGGDVFLWKKTELPATPERLLGLEKFRAQLEAILAAPIQ